MQASAVRPLMLGSNDDTGIREIVAYDAGIGN